MDDPLASILEACYRSIADGSEPDLETACGGDPELEERVSHILARERRLVAACTSDPQPRHDELPTRIGEFTILELLGRGGMGQVYRARQESLGREVALKVLREDAIDSDTARLRFQREATITAALDHPNIVPVFATGEDGGRTYLAMKLLRGRALDELPLPLEPEKVARIGAAVADALHAAHQVGVLHRDVKPANVLLENDTPYVVDFGLARWDGSHTALTQAHAAPGTLAYMAPELLQQAAAPFDVRIDVYGLGATLYELLAGRAPFVGDLPVRVLRQVLLHDPQPLRLAGRHRDLETIAMRALEKTPSRRFASAAEMADELRRYDEGRPIRSRPIGPLQRCWRVARRHRVVAVLVATAAALIAALAAVLWVAADEQRDQRARELAAVERHRADGDAPAALRILGELRREHGEDAELQSLAADTEAELQLGSLMTLLQSPSLHRDRRALRDMVQRLAVMPSPVARSARATATAAIVALLLGDEGGAALDDTARQAYPRTAAALEAQRRGADAAAALRATDQTGGPTDHLLAALVLRVAHRPLAMQERELGRADLTGRDGDAIRFSQAVVLEGRAEYLAAYHALAPLVDSPLHGAVALAGRARLAGRLGEFERARQHLAAAHDALPEGGGEHLHGFLVLSELQLVLDEHGGGERFWSLWEQHRQQVRHRPFFWLLGGYARAMEGKPEAARALFEQGLACDTDGFHRASLELAMIQNEWRMSPAAVGMDLVGGEGEAERQRLAALAERAEALAQRAAATGGERRFAADALLVAAQCLRATGSLQRSWALLEKACRDYGEPEALVDYAFRVAYRVLLAYFAEAPFDDPDEPFSGPLAEAVALAHERAAHVMDRIVKGEPIDPALAPFARQALLACSFHRADAETALPLAHLLVADGATQEPVRRLCRRVIDWGGLPLDRLLSRRARPRPSPERLRILLERAVGALRRGAEGGWLPAEQVRAAAERWCALPALAARREQHLTPAWAALWRDIDALARAESPR